MKCLGDTTLQWFWVVSWVGLLLWTYLAIRMRGELRQARDAASKEEKAVTSNRDAYRTATQPLDETEVRRVYCTDCRFKSVSAGGYTVCLAMPSKGRYLTVGQSETNANHDCMHYQAKEKS